MCHGDVHCMLTPAFGNKHSHFTISPGAVRTLPMPICQQATTAQPASATRLCHKSAVKANALTHSLPGMAGSGSGQSASCQWDPARRPSHAADQRWRAGSVRSQGAHLLAGATCFSHSNCCCLWLARRSGQAVHSLKQADGVRLSSLLQPHPPCRLQPEASKHCCHICM